MAKKKSNQKSNEKKVTTAKPALVVGKCPCGKTHERRSPYCSKACYEKFDSHGSAARSKAKKEGITSAK